VVPWTAGGRPEVLHVGAACDGVVTGIQIRARAGDIAVYRIKKNPEKPLWLQPILVNRVENLRVFGL